MRLTVNLEPDLYATAKSLALVPLLGLIGWLVERPESVAAAVERDATPRLRLLHNGKEMIEARITKEQQSCYWGGKACYSGITFWYSPNSGREQTDAIHIVTYNMFSGSIAETHLLTILFGYSGTLFHRADPSSPSLISVLPFA